MESRRAGDAVAIEQRNRGIAERGGAIDEHLRERGSAKETEGGGSVQFDIHGRTPQRHRDTELGCYTPVPLSSPSINNAL